MAIYIVSDLHGASDELKKAIPESNTLLLLGDLLNLLDYTNYTGILADVFSVEAVREVAELRAQGRVQEARALMRQRSEGREDEIRQEIGRRVVEQYTEVFAALPHPTYLILGNVDHPELAHGFAQDNPAVIEADSQVFTFEGETFGFVGGALPSPLNVPGEISEQEMARRLDSIGEVDVLCTHIPPDVPELCYDTLAAHPERGSKDILRYIQDVQPTRAYFGHVHQPLVSVMHIGRTMCINVGYFRATKRPFPHRPDRSE